MVERTTPIFFESDLSSAALDRLKDAPMEFIQVFGANTLAHVALGVITAIIVTRYVYQAMRNEAGLLLLCAIALKDFSLDWWAYSREWLVLFDALWDVASYYIGWRLIESHSGLIARRTRAAFNVLLTKLGVRDAN